MGAAYEETVLTIFKFVALKNIPYACRDMG